MGGVDGLSATHFPRTIPPCKARLRRRDSTPSRSTATWSFGPSIACTARRILIASRSRTVPPMRCWCGQRAHGPVAVARGPGLHNLPLCKGRSPKAWGPRASAHNGHVMRMRGDPIKRGAKRSAFQNSTRTERASARGARSIPKRAALAQGGPRDAAWAAGSGATDSLCAGRGETMLGYSVPSSAAVVVPSAATSAAKRKGAGASAREDNSRV
jgi:hypothetical protein